MQTVRVGALLVSLSLIGCGDDGPTKLVDSGIGNTDTPPKVCTAVTIGQGDISGETLGSYMSLYAEAPETINGLPVQIGIELYHSVTANLAGTFDLSQAPDDNYATCGICVYAFTYDPNTGQADKFFFQQEGSITFTQDPVTQRHLTATITGLKLQEADLASDFTSTFLPTGDCASIASATWDDDNIPNDWTCDTAGQPTTYYSGTGGNCDCQCGVYDPDCRAVGATVNGCSTAGQACAPDANAGAVCVTKPANDTCATAAALTPNGGTVTGNSLGADRDYNMGLNAATCTKYRQPGPDLAYAVSLTGGTAYTFKLTGLGMDHDGGIALVGPDTVGDGAICSDNITTCVAGYDEGFGGDDETFAYTPTTTGTYYLIVDSYNLDDSGPFTVEVTSP